MKSENLVWHPSSVTRDDRERQHGHRGRVLWFTGLSGAGKSTLAHAVDKTLHLQGKKTTVLDGDNVRHGLCADLGFSPDDRRENLRRIAEVAKLFAESGIITLAAFISPMREDRAMVKRIIGENDFMEIYVQCPLDVCEARDAKGMYRKARAGELSDFTGISAPYEAPEDARLVLQTDIQMLDKCVMQVVSWL